MKNRDASPIPKGEESLIVRVEYAKPVNKYRDFMIIGLMNKMKLQMYMAYSSNLKYYFAMRAYPRENDEVSPLYLREARMGLVIHPHILTILDTQLEKKCWFKDGKSVTISYILLELAPYGSFKDLLDNNKIPQDEKFARTYFKQFISALEKLHESGYAHMNLKLEHMLLGENYDLKLTGFNYSWTEADGAIHARGTKDYRAPELKRCQVTNQKACDIFSAGVILFLLMTGLLPFKEDRKDKELDLQYLATTYPMFYWDKYTEYQNYQFVNWTDDLKELFSSLVRADPDKRATFEQIKKNPWIEGPVYTKEELNDLMMNKLGVVSPVKKNDPKKKK